MATTDKELEKNASCTTGSACGSAEKEQQKLKQAQLEVEKKLAQAEKKQSGGCCGG